MDLLQYFERLYVEFYKHLTAIEFNKGSTLDRTIMSLYATILEQAYDALVLQRAGQHVTLDIILRSSLEAYVDLINLCSDSNYYQQMQASFHEQWIKLAQHGVKGGNPFLNGFENSEDAVAQLKWHEEQLAELGVAPLNVFERFRKAGLEDVYRSIYNSLCNETHNNIRALTNRHFRLNDHDEPEITIFAPAEKLDLISTLSSFIGILTRSSWIVHDYFQTSALPAVLEIREDHSRFIKEYEAQLEAESPPQPNPTQQTA